MLLVVIEQRMVDIIITFFMSIFQLKNHRVFYYPNNTLFLYFF